MGTVDIDLFKPELVFFDIDAGNREDLFSHLGHRLKEAGYIEETWFDAIAAREREYPTGLACQAINVAIPHTDQEHLARPYIAIVRPRSPVVFEAMAHMGDDVPAELIVNLGLMAHEDGQVAVLQALMGIFMDAEASAEILAQRTPQGMVEVMRRRCRG